MNYLNTHIISWKWFFILLAILFGLLFIYRYILKGMISRFLSDAHGKRIDTRFIVLQRFLTIGWFILLALIFVMVSPYVHGIVILVCIALMYRYLSNFMQGTLLIRELDLANGMRFSFEKGNGIIDRLGATGMMISIADQNHFLAYDQLLQSVGSALQKNIRTAKINLTAQLPEGQNIEQAKDKILAQLFISPFIKDEEKPQIEVRDGRVNISLLLKHPDYLSNVQETIEKSGLKIIPPK